MRRVSVVCGCLKQEVIDAPLARNGLFSLPPECEHQDHSKLNVQCVPTTGIALTEALTEAQPRLVRQRAVS